MDRSADLLARAKLKAHTITYDELVARGLAAFEGAGFSRDEIEDVAKMVGWTAEDVAHSIATAGPFDGRISGQDAKGQGLGDNERRLLAEIRCLLERPVVEAARGCLAREEAAQYLGIEPTQLDYLVRVRKIRFVKLGNQRGRVFRMDDLDEFLEQNVQPTAEEMLRRKQRPR